MFGFSGNQQGLSPEQQALLADKMQGLVLYHYESCPFCRRVRQFIHQQGLPLKEKDILQDSQYREELLAGGGKTQVPCLNISAEGEKGVWLYESMDIIRYLQCRLDEI